jgi:hypothetical protein
LPFRDSRLHSVIKLSKELFFYLTGIISRITSFKVVLKNLTKPCQDYAGRAVLPIRPADHFLRRLLAFAPYHQAAQCQHCQRYRLGNRKALAEAAYVGKAVGAAADKYILGYLYMHLAGAVIGSVSVPHA